MKIIRGVVRTACLGILYFACFVVPTMIIPVGENVRKQMEARPTSGVDAPILLAFCVVAALCISYPIRRASWHGMPLVLGMTASTFGLLTFMGQIETFYFHSAFPVLTPGEITNIILRGLLTAALFIPGAVALNGRWRGATDDQLMAGLVHIPWKEWALRIPLLAAVYVALYFSFGYYVAWQFPEVRQFYTGSTELLAVEEHIARIGSDSPLFFPLQLLRGLLWIVFAVPLLLILRGKRRATVTSLTLLFALFGIQIIIPNPLFPDIVRYAHLLETAVSTAIYGALIGWLLYLPAVPPREDRALAPPYPA